jgi:hypothetical protein
VRSSTCIASRRQSPASVSQAGSTPCHGCVIHPARTASATSTVIRSSQDGGQGTRRAVPSLLVVGAHLGGEADMAAALDIVTTAPARILGRQDHGLAVGGRADLIVVEAATLAEAVGALPARALVVKGGPVVEPVSDSPSRRRSGALDSEDGATYSSDW